jgi:signal transduction histidine kinase
MRCPKCSTQNAPDATRCTSCGDSLAIAVFEVIRGYVPDRIRFLRPRDYSIGRARNNDICLNEPSISKLHARLQHYGGRFFIEDAGSLHGVYVNASRVRRAELSAGAQVQLGNVTLRYSPLGSDGATGAIGQTPWGDQQQRLLSLVETLNATLVLSQVLEQVLDGVVLLTAAERGFLLLVDDDPQPDRYPTVAGLRLRVARPGSSAATVSVSGPLGGRSGAIGYGIASSVVRQVMETGELVIQAPDPAAETGPVAGPDGEPGGQSLACFPLRSPRSSAGGFPNALGVVYVDNAASAEAFGGEALRAAEALVRHAALAIDNAQLFEREQRTIEELQRTQKQLLQSEKLATIGQMAAGIAHELNTPLTYIMGNLELLDLQPLSPAQREMLSSVARGAERIRTLAHRLLVFSRPSSEEMSPLVVNDIVERSLELCRYQIASGRVELVRRLADALPPVLGVSNQLETALINVLVNAVHAMGEDGGTLTVGTAAVAGEVEITVADDGPGIPDSIRASIFEPFVTTKPEGKGTGLGLSTVLMVVERHNGRVSFQSNPVRGTTFRIVLPAAPAA